MKITVKETFLHDRDRFEPGEVREVDDDLADYFISQGWAEGPDGYEPQDSGPPENVNQEVTLDIQNTSHKQGAKHG